MEGLERILKEHPFFAAFEPAHIQLLAGCARNHRFAAGEYLFREGDPANEFFLIRQGKVALEIAATGQGAHRVRDLERWRGRGRLMARAALSLDVRRARHELTRAIGMDAKCLRGKCDADHHLGYAMMKSFLPVLVTAAPSDAGCKSSTSMGEH